MPGSTTPAVRLPLGLPVFALEDYFARWEFTARHHLTASDAESMTVAALCDLTVDPEAARAGLLDLHLGYLPTSGTDGLRDAIAGMYEQAERADVLTFAGAEEAMFWALLTLLEPGDHAVVTVPNYQSMEALPAAAGASVTGVPLWTGTGDDLRWVLDVDRVAAALRPDTRVVAVNFPNNPTGFVPDAATWSALIDLCEARGITLFSDEVYRGIEADRSATLPAAVDRSPRALSLGVVSKSLCLPGLRVGWIACRDRALLARLERCKHYTSICNAAPSEYLARLAILARDQIFERARRIVADNAATVDAFFAEYPGLFSWTAPDGGCVAFPRYGGGEGVERFCADLVREQGVLLLPASMYRSGLAEVPADRFRIGLGRLRPQDGLAAVRAHLGSRP